MDNHEDALKRSAFSLRDEQLEQALLTGEHSGLLEDYFSEEGYQELRELAAEAKTRSVRGGPRVLILPGIMGSKLGRPRLLFDDVLWIDPAEMALGRLTRLRLPPGEKTFEEVGVILLAYLKLKLRLRLRGFDASFYPYDWRQSIDVLGAGLRDHIRKKERADVYIVAHSMGGLVTRAAIAQDGRGIQRIQRFVMLGTPNFGSFVPVQLLRASHPTLHKVAALDLFHGAEELVSGTFNTFPSLYQMLPAPARFGSLPLYDPEQWPSTGPRPRPELLQDARRVQDALAPADERFFLIAGVEQETMTGLEKDGDEYVYVRTNEGDGTVPLAFAELPDTKTYYIEESHGSLPNNRTVARAVAEIIDSGRTSVLADARRAPSRVAARRVRDKELQVAAFDGRQGSELSQREVRAILDDFVSPSARDEVTAEAEPSAPPLERVIVGRRRQHRIDVRLALGSITEVDARAYVAGMFANVAPGGAARVLDARLDGAISEFTSRRMFSGRVGEVFVLPTGRHGLRAEMVVLAGLGAFDRFSGDVQQQVAENVIRTFIRTRIEDVATVMIGAGTGRDEASTLRNLIVGFLRGLVDADRDHHFRRVTLCEIDRTRFEAMRREVFRLSGTPLFQDVEVTFDEVVLPAAPAVVSRRPRAAGPDPAYVIARRESEDETHLEIRSSILTAGAKATVISGTRRIRKRDLDRHLKKIEGSSFTFGRLDDFGNRLSDLVLSDEVKAGLAAMRDRHLVVVHDAHASRVPWETLHLGDWAPAAEQGLSRRYEAENLAAATWLEERLRGPVLKLLLVVDPTEDLEGAEREGTRVRELFGGHAAVRIDELRQSEATKPIVMEKIRSGEYDVLHYAGHAFFDPANPSRSGIFCHRKEVLSGAELVGLGNLPSLVFFNACEAARVRKRGAPASTPTMDELLQKSVGLAEAFLRGGVANYVGTYWPVGDAPAASFAEVFYNQILAGKSIGRAVVAGREEVRNLRSVDWADYIHYGWQDFVLKPR